ncbi:MAG TPA: FAD-dependent oxidoreductase, partial [Albitalea sp.]|nr:FAD-dependent oxidoreductase [Albitalea sp.]
GLSPSWPVPKVFQSVYGALYAPVEGSPLAALTFQPGQAPGDGPIVCAMLGAQAAGGAIHLNDAELTRFVVEAMEAHLPGIGRAAQATHLKRWQAAEPLSPVGRARAVATYRASLGSALGRDRRVVLAGDYLGSPWTDGAAETGRWAAQHLLAARTQPDRMTVAQAIA